MLEPRYQGGVSPFSGGNGRMKKALAEIDGQEMVTFYQQNRQLQRQQAAHQKAIEYGVDLAKHARTLAGNDQYLAAVVLPFVQNYVTTAKGIISNNPFR